MEEYTLQVAELRNRLDPDPSGIGREYEVYVRRGDGVELAHALGDSIARAVMRVGVQLDAQPEVRQAVHR